MRTLSAEEQALWARVTATIRPLSREPQNDRADRNEPKPVPAVAQTRTRPALPAVSSRRLPPLRRTLDSTWDRKLGSGTVRPDRIVDLHGHNLDRAWRAIDSALEQAISSGERVVLLITGHERADEPPVERGRIRAAVHDWLAASRHSECIAAVRGAHRRHGGGGSLYIVLRRR